MQRAGLHRAGLRVRADGEHVGVDGGVDGCGNVGVGTHRKVDRSGGVQGQVEVGVEVQQRHDLLGRQGRAYLLIEVCGAQRLEFVLGHGDPPVRRYVRRGTTYSPGNFNSELIRRKSKPKHHHHPPSQVSGRLYGIWRDRAPLTWLDDPQGHTQ